MFPVHGAGSGRPDATWLGADAVGGRGMLGLIASAQQAAMSRPGHYTAPGARTHLKNTYLPSWKALFLHETDAAYPMPKAGEVLDLLPALQGIPGAAIKTDPGTTVTEGMGYAMLAAGMQRDVETLKAFTVGWQANGQAFGGQPACGGCCPGPDQQHVPAKEVCASSTLGGLCRRVPGAYLPGWRMPMGDSGSMGSATDADEDGITGLIYLAELTDDDDVRAYAVKSIAAFVIEDLGLADPPRNSRRVPVTGDIPESLQRIWLWRGGTCWGGYDLTATDTAVNNRNLCIAPAYFSPGQVYLLPGLARV
jgi:hypothetical protein